MYLPSGDHEMLVRYLSSSKSVTFNSLRIFPERSQMHIPSFSESIPAIGYLIPTALPVLVVMSKSGNVDTAESSLRYTASFFPSGEGITPVVNPNSSLLMTHP